MLANCEAITETHHAAPPAHSASKGLNCEFKHCYHLIIVAGSKDGSKLSCF
jgi:hypothetical protein